MTYEYNKKQNKFTENGHTMFEFDVLQRLKRLDHLEQENKELREAFAKCLNESEHLDDAKMYFNEHILKKLTTK